MNAICIDCREPFLRQIGRGRPRIRCASCSPEQRRPPGAYVGLNVTSRPREAACPACGSTFTATFVLQRYCTDQCRIDAGNARQSERTAAASAPWRSETRRCKQCEVEFQPTAKHQVYCSDRCQDLRPTRQGRAHLRRARAFGCVIEPFDKIKVFERDGWRCQGCGASTPRELMGQRVSCAPELDHVVPLSRGGAHAMSNAQCLCNSCNRRKADKMPHEFEALAA